jgi:hypothetical protein
MAEHSSQLPEPACLDACMSCMRVSLTRVQAHFAKYEPTILELKRKYELAMKEKMLAGLDRDKMAAKVSWLCCRHRYMHATRSWQSAV